MSRQRVVVAAAIAGLLALGVAAVLGIGGEEWDGGERPKAGPSSSPSPQPPNPIETYSELFRPLDNADPVDPSVPPLEVGKLRVTLDDVRASMTAGRDCRGGEAAARDLAKLIMDAESGSSGGEILEAVAAPELPVPVRRFLEQDLDIQAAGGSRRHYDLSVGGYYRSKCEGGRAQPAMVRFEIAALAVAKPLKIQAWYLTRYDVAWNEGQGWGLSDFSGAGWGPSEARPTRQQLAAFLTGPGWRSFGK